MTDLKIARGFSLPLDVVTESVAILANKGSGKTSTSAVLIEEMHAAGIQVVALDHTGVYWGMTSDAAGTGPGLPFYVLGGDHGDVPLESTSGAFVADLVVDSGHSFILDVSLFETAEEEHRFVTDFAKRLYRRKGAAKNKTILHFVIDEADEYAPQKPMGVQGNMMKRAIETLVRRGRSRGIGTTMISQRSAVLNKDVLNMIETLIVLRTVAPGDQEAIRKWISDKQLRDESGVMDSLNKLPTGEAWVWSPQRGVLERIAVRRTRTFDSYRAPKAGEALAEPVQRAELDLGALGEQMSATVERAKENDPAELKRRIRQLETAVAAKPTPERVEVEVPVEMKVEVPVEVPMLTADQMVELRELAARLEAVVPLADLLRAIVQSSITQSSALRAQRVERPPVKRAAVAPPPPRAPSSAPAAAGVSGPQQKILDALAWFEAIGVDTPRRPPLAAVAGVSSKSSGFRANVSTLSGLGLIAYPDGGRVTLTEAGRQTAVPPVIAPTKEALHDAICDMVSGPQAVLLRILIAEGGAAVDREELARRAGVSAASSGFRANISTLSGFELVIYPSPGYIAAADMLFPY